MYKIVGVAVLSLYLYKSCVAQFLYVLGYGGLRIIKMIYKILIAYSLTLLVLLHYISENFYSGRVSQGVGYFRYEENILFLHLVHFFSQSHSLLRSLLLNTVQILHDSVGYKAMALGKRMNAVAVFAAFSVEAVKINKIKA